jgi:hypothetical protein
VDEYCCIGKSIRGVFSSLQPGPLSSRIDVAVQLILFCMVYIVVLRAFMSKYLRIGTKRVVSVLASLLPLEFR